MRSNVATITPRRLVYSVFLGVVTGIIYYAVYLYLLPKTISRVSKVPMQAISAVPSLI